MSRLTLLPLGEYASLIPGPHPAFRCLQYGTGSDKILGAATKLQCNPRALSHLKIGLHPQVTADGNQSNLSSVPTPDTCSDRLARTDALNCSSDVVYTQPTCQEHLLPLQGCLPDRLSSRDVYISATNQEAVEAQASELLSGLDLLGPSPECRAAVQPFLCLYLFGLCDSRSTAYLPTFEECILISTDVCESEWATANSFLSLRGLPSLPVCTSFPSTASAISGNRFFSHTVVWCSFNTCTHICMMLFRLLMQVVVAVERVGQPSHLQQEQDWLGRSTVALFNAKKTFPVLL